MKSLMKNVCILLVLLRYLYHDARFRKREVCISTKGKKMHTVNPTGFLTVEVSNARFQFFMAVFMKDGVLTNVTPCTLITFD
jgi:hypothetical protein